GLARRSDGGPRRIDAESWDSALGKRAQQRGVAAAELDHETVRTELVPGNQRRRDGARFGEALGRARRELGAVEEPVRRAPCGRLDQRAIAAKQQTERDGNRAKVRR